MKNTETESYKRLMSLDRVAGPDDPIYSSGLTVSYVQRPTPSTSSSPQSTDGLPKESSSSAQDDPMQPAIDQIERALRAKDAQVMAEYQAQKASK